MKLYAQKAATANRRAAPTRERACFITLAFIMEPRSPHAICTALATGQYNGRFPGLGRLSLMPRLYRERRNFRRCFYARRTLGCGGLRAVVGSKDAFCARRSGSVRGRPVGTVFPPQQNFVPAVGGDPFSVGEKRSPAEWTSMADGAVVQVGPPVQLFLDRRDGPHFLIEGVKLDHRARRWIQTDPGLDCTESSHRIRSNSFTKELTR